MAGVMDFAYGQGWVAIAYAHAGLGIWDFAKPYAPRPLALLGASDALAVCPSLTTIRYQAAALREDRLLAAVDDCGLALFDVERPAEPKLLGGVELRRAGSSSDAALDADTDGATYLAAAGSTCVALRAADPSDLAGAVLRRFKPTRGGTEYSCDKVERVGSDFFVLGTSPGDSRLFGYRFDAAAKASRFWVSAALEGGGAVELRSEDGKLVAHSGAGIAVFDAAASPPAELGRLAVDGGYGAAIAGGRYYAAEWSDVLFGAYDSGGVEAPGYELPADDTYRAFARPGYVLLGGSGSWKAVAAGDL